MSQPQVHVVFGAGQVGPRLARRLLAQGHTVRVVRRGDTAPPAGATLVRGDATDPKFTAEAAAGANAIYHVMNPAEYSVRAWSEQLPRFMAAMLEAAARSGARLVVLDNLYALGRAGGAPVTESTPEAPVSRKGEIRLRVATQLWDAQRRGDVRAICGRASDFYGPGGVGTHFAEFFWTRVLAGKSAQMLVRPDHAHTYHFTEDVAAGLALLGGAPDDAFGRWWALPCAPAVSTREMVAAMGRALGREIPVETMPALMRHAAGLFMPVLREIGEMLYQWEQPFVVDDSAFRAKFGASGTPIDDGARATVEWAKAVYGAK